MLFAITITVATACTVAVFTRGSDTSPVFLILLAPPALYVCWSFMRWCLRYLTSKDLFSPALAFPLAYTAWFSIGSFDFLNDGKEPTYWYFVLGAVSYFAGIRLFGLLRRSSIIQPSSFRNEWEHRRYWFVVLLFSLLTAGSYLYMVRSVGVTVFDPEVAERRFELGQYGAMKAALLSSGWTLFILLGVRLHDAWGRKHFRWTMIFCLILLSLVLLSFGNRGFLLIPLLTLVIALHYVYKRYSVGRLAFVFVLFFAAVGVFGYARDVIARFGYTTQQDTLLGAIYPFIYPYEYVRNSVAGFSDLTRIIPATVPYQKGWLTFGALAQALPGHHESSDLFFEQLFGGNYSGGFPTTLLGPFYGDFGLAGIITGMFLFGCLMRFLYLWMKSRPTLFRVAIYAWVMQTAILGLFGSLFTYIITLFVPLMWVALDFVMKAPGRNHAGIRVAD
jgi:oligosaccharide repeat unit polymerase